MERHILVAASVALVAAAVALLAACATTGGAGRVSADDPAVEGLRTLDGEPFDLAGVVSDHDATVLFWWATRCPCVKRYQERMETLRADYPEDRVAMLAVSSNADDDAESVARVAAERRFPLPIVRDAAARLADRLGVTSTPTTVILDRSGAVRFVGWIDNERKPGARGREPWAREALEAVLADREPAASRAPVYGCAVTHSLDEAPACEGP
ncbi:MAG: redoxin domain-containing protein [Myxococcota bacterium]